MLQSERLGNRHSTPFLSRGLERMVGGAGLWSLKQINTEPLLWNTPNPCHVCICLMMRIGVSYTE